jgi:hypothetical protein
VQYTYAVTAFDIGMQSFNVEFLSTASGIANEIGIKCDVGDLIIEESDLEPLLGIEGYCESLPSCDWNAADKLCQYSNENYCSGNDSYCSGMECCAAASCCNYDLDGDGIQDEVLGDKTECLASAWAGDVYWIPDTYSDQST